MEDYEQTFNYFQQKVDEVLWAKINYYVKYFYFITLLLLMQKKTEIIIYSMWTSAPSTEKPAMAYISGSI